MPRLQRGQRAWKGTLEVCQRCTGGKVERAQIAQTVRKVPNLEHCTQVLKRRHPKAPLAHPQALRQHCAGGTHRQRGGLGLGCACVRDLIGQHAQAVPQKQRAHAGERPKEELIQSSVMAFTYSFAYSEGKQMEGITRHTSQAPQQRSASSRGQPQAGVWRAVHRGRQRTKTS